MRLFDPARKFYKGNTHTHTTNSDGRVSPEECAAQYRAAGYDFIALTDHWFAGEASECGGMLVLPGAEYDFSFPTQVLHLVCLFPDAKLAAPLVRGMSHTEVISHVRRAGGVVIAAHPAWSLNTPDLLKSLDGVDIAEVFNTVSGEPFNGPRADAENLLDITAANGKLFCLAAADDAHFYRGDQCVSYIMLQAEELTVPAILDALKQGRFYASQGPEFRNIELRGSRLIVETSPVSRITVLSNRAWARERCAAGENLTERTYEIYPDETFVRVRLTDAQGRMAWSSPIVPGGR